MNDSRKVQLVNGLLVHQPQMQPIYRVGGAYVFSIKVQFVKAWWFYYSRSWTFDVIYSPTFRWPSH